MNARSNDESYTYRCASFLIDASGATKNLFSIHIASTATRYLRIRRVRLHYDDGIGAATAVCRLYRATVIAAGASTITPSPVDPLAPAAQAVVRCRTASDHGALVDLTATLGVGLASWSGPRTATHVGSIGGDDFVDMIEEPVIVPIPAAGVSGLVLRNDTNDGAVANYLAVFVWEELTP